MKLTSILKGRGAQYEKKYLYIRSLDRIVYCHAYMKDNLIIGDASPFLSSAKSSLLRYHIKVKELQKHNPIIIDPEKLASYDFMHQHKWQYREGWVWGTKQTLDEIASLKFVELPGAEYTHTMDKEIVKLLNS